MTDQQGSPTERFDPPASAPEREMLESWLDFHRATLLLKCEGLDDTAIRTRSVPPSSLSLLGLVRHMADVERYWFLNVLEDRRVPHEYSTRDNPDGEFDDVETADAARDLTAFRDAVARSRRVAAQHGLDDLAAVERHGRRASLRWIYVHMIEEYARHNGHADLLRERIDGVTGM